MVIPWIRAAWRLWAAVYDYRLLIARRKTASSSERFSGLLGMGRQQANELQATQANIQMEPTHPPTCAILAGRRAAHLDALDGRTTEPQA